MLTIMYTTLKVATVFETWQLAGYLSLLHIYLKLLFLIDFLFNFYEYHSYLLFVMFVDISVGYTSISPPFVTRGCIIP